MVFVSVSEAAPVVLLMRYWLVCQYEHNYGCHNESWKLGRLAYHTSVYEFLYVPARHLLGIYTHLNVIDGIRFHSLDCYYMELHVGMLPPSWEITDQANDRPDMMLPRILLCPLCGTLTRSACTRDTGKQSLSQFGSHFIAWSQLYVSSYTTLQMIS